MSAANAFNCVCCRNDKPEDEAVIDQQLGGPVCEECRKDLIKAVAWLKHAGITRPLEVGDINNHNCNRFKGYNNGTNT